MVDSLTRAATAIEHDPRVQERVARRQFGTPRLGEFLSRIVPAENTAATGRGPADPASRR